LPDGWTAAQSAHKIVMAGLDPAIDQETKVSFSMDARVKPAHDELP
jgi:hypothetical protein